MSVYHREQFAQERLVLRLRREWALRSLLRLQLPAEPLAYHVGSVHSSPGREDSNLQIWKPPWTPRKLPVPHGRGRKKDITSERSRARAGSRTPEYTLRIYTCNLCKSTVITLQPCRQPALGASLRLLSQNGRSAYLGVLPHIVRVLQPLLDFLETPSDALPRARTQQRGDMH